MQPCVDCGEEKPPSEYYVYKSGSAAGNRYKRCKACHYVLTRANLKKNPERIRERERARYHAGLKHKKRWEKIRKKYGLSQEEYETLLASQGNVCAICLKRFPQTWSGSSWDAPSVDHCHESGKVRGILHRRCNLAIEFLLTPEERERAIAYLSGSTGLIKQAA